MNSPEPVIVAHLFPELLDSLVALLADLEQDDWEHPTVCPGWSVRDVALHLLAGEIGILSRQRDRYEPYAHEISSWEDLVRLINRLNAEWVQATRRLSPRLLTELLQFTGPKVNTYFQSLDPFVMGGPVDWAGPEAAPVWLDLAREYTERWHHQQQIRDAVNRPGMKSPRHMKPVCDTFVRALPHSYRHTVAEVGAVVAVKITGESGGRWALVREVSSWQLYVGEPRNANAVVAMDDDTAWRMFTKGIKPGEIKSNVRLEGEEELGIRMLETIAIIG